MLSLPTLKHVEMTPWQNHKDSCHLTYLQYLLYRLEHEPMRSWEAKHYRRLERMQKVMSYTRR